ncbi:hypothetical protein [Brevibacillus massiliensis]|nr:hypothetical protein [Brevibacillus massiliensis]
MQDLPIKVDLVHGADGLELQEIIQSLWFRAKSIQEANPFLSSYLIKVAEKHEKLYQERQNVLLKVLLTKTKE